MTNDKVRWRGWGKWLAVAAGAALIALAIAQLIGALGTREATRTVGAIGWNLFLGLLALGGVLSGDRRAPTLMTILAVLMAVRAVLGLALGLAPIAIAVDGAVLALTAAAAFDLRQQRR